LATITLTTLFNDLQEWPGRLLEAPTGTLVTFKSATQFNFRYPAGTDFAGYTVGVTGTGFVYDGNTPLDGVMSAVRIFNASGQLVIAFGGLGTNPVVNDLSQFAVNVLGALSSPDSGVDPNGKVAWSHLLAGNDVTTGTAGNDRRGFVGVDAGNDLFNMGAGDDWVNGGIGNDTIDGGDGADGISYRETHYNEGLTAIRGATVNLTTGVALDPWGGVDRLISVENADGSRFADRLTGNAERNNFTGGRGRDTIDGGVDTYASVGGPRSNDTRDRVDYSDDYWVGGTRGINANLETSFNGTSIFGRVIDGFGQTDILIDIERVQGTRFNDVFVGSHVNNQFRGGEGKDAYYGRDGWDTIVMDWRAGDVDPGSVSVDLRRATDQIINDGFGNTEIAQGIEGWVLSNAGDRFIGSAAEQEVFGRRGADTMTGGVGRDTFVWEEREEFGQGDLVTDFQASGAGADVLAFYTPEIVGMSSTLTLVIGQAATVAGVDTFVFNPLNNTLSWDPDGAGGEAALAVALLQGVTTLTAANFELWT
jgi:Ca2+-binding RTX toxin-like protein